MTGTPTTGTEGEAGWVAELAETLVRRKVLAGDGPTRFEPLSGGVSSDIWAIRRGAECVVVKRALAKLRVTQDWRAPVERNAADAQWLRTVETILPGAVPRVLYEDDRAGLFVMSWFDPAAAPVWKGRLLAGVVDVAFAAAVGRAIGQIHQATAGRADIAGRFDNAATFHALRIAPYLEATASRHPALAGRIGAIADRTSRCRQCLIHGDVSPKNILVGAGGPIFLDAECATYGDPAFDLAFCLNHLLLKCLPAGDPAPLLHAFAALAAGYRVTAAFAPAADVEIRAAALLPALFLARVDGKSPVEYLTEESDRALVRGAARRWLEATPPSLDEIASDWGRVLLKERVK